MNFTDLYLVSSYEEDTDMVMLISSKSNHDLRLSVNADAQTGAIKEIVCAISTNEGFYYPEYSPTKAQLALFRKFSNQIINGAKFVRKMIGGHP